jgi:23S rRNA pseudouridine1911/1915/1917 synthase
MLEILYKNNQLLAVNKPPGIAVQPDKTGDETLLQQAEAYSRHPMHVIHRIDRPVSGIVLFAQIKTAMINLSEQLHHRTVDKEYLAVVQNPPPHPEGTLVHFIRKNEAKNISVAQLEEVPGLDKGELHYRLIGSSERYHLLRIRLITGRHHQIRAQLAAIGCPIKGDVKYGARRGNPDRSIHLHAWRLAFDHPVSGERVQLEAPVPQTDAVWKAFNLAPGTTL